MGRDTNSPRPTGAYQRAKAVATGQPPSDDAPLSTPDAPVEKPRFASPAAEGQPATEPVLKSGEDDVPGAAESGQVAIGEGPGGASHLGSTMDGGEAMPLPTSPARSLVPPKNKNKNKGKRHIRPHTSGKLRPPVDQTNWRTRLQTARIKFDDEFKEIYLTELREHGMKGRAANAAGVSNQTARNHLENDPEFAEAAEEAHVTYRDKFVDHAIHDLAYKGIEIKKYDKEGNLVEERRDYPIRLIEMELKRIEPGYRDKQTIDINSGGGVLVAPAEMTPQDWIAREIAANEERDALAAAEEQEAGDE